MTQAQHEALIKAESFISGFEGDDTQEGIDELLAEIREAIAANEIADECTAALSSDLESMIEAIGRISKAIAKVTGGAS